MLIEKVCQGSWIFWTNLGLFWKEHKTWFCIETRWDSEVFVIWGSFGLETWSWNQRMEPKSHPAEENLSDMTNEKSQIFLFFFFFKWSNQGMYAIRLWIIWYDCTHIFGECSEGRHSRGTQVADTCLIHEETPSVSVKDICPPGYNQDTQESESPKFCITTIRENYKLSLVIERQKE